MPRDYPSRIVCLTEETTETLYLLGEERRIVGISGFTVRPPRARREKTRVSAFTSAKIGRIVELRPDLVLGFSDLQADIAAELIRLGIEVHVFNQRSVAEILRMIAMLGGMVGDHFGALWGLRGRTTWLFIVLFCEGVLLMVFSQTRSLALAIPMLMGFGLFVKMSNGATYSVTPFINRNAMGAVAGIVGAGGNVGAVAAGGAAQPEETPCRSR